jgi:hypothetical protein
MTVQCWQGSYRIEATTQWLDSLGSGTNLYGFNALPNDMLALPERLL